MQIFNLGLSLSGFSIPILTELLIFIDYGVYYIARLALDGFFVLVRFTGQIFSSTNNETYQKIQAIIGRVMVLAGIYALFKLSIMLINTLIDPSKLKETEKTGTTIMKNAFIAIILLLTSNFIFSKLGEFQLLVIDSKVIENIIYGPSETENSRDSAKFTNKVWTLFILSDGKNPTDKCREKFDKVADGRLDIISFIGCHDDKGYQYVPIVPFIVGILLIYYFIIYSIELGIRMLKLLVLQMIFPIPVILSIDPKQKDKLGKYAGLYGQIYAQVFLRILSFHLAFAIAFLALNYLESGFNEVKVNFLLKIIVIIGVFKGMKEIPKLIEDAIGVKINGGPGRTFGAAISGIIGGTAGLVGGAVTGAVTGGFGGALLGGIRGLSTGVGSKNWGEVKKNVVAGASSASIIGKNIKTADGFGGYMGGMFRSKTGYQSRVDNQVNQEQRKFDQINKMREAIEKEYANKTVPLTDLNGNAILDKNGTQIMRKAGTIDEDPNVIAAQAQLSNYINSGGNDQQIISQYQSDIVKAKNNYHTNALNSFGNDNGIDMNGNLELRDNSGNVLDPLRNYDDLTEAQRAYVDYTRLAGEKMNYGTQGNFASVFDAIENQTKSNLKGAKKKQESIKYQHAQAYKNDK